VKATLSNKLLLATVKQYAVDFMVEEGFAPGGIDVRDQFVLETAMRAIRISFKYPAKVLQQDREIVRYPATLWSHLLHSIGLGKYATYNAVLLNEHFAFPHIELPDNLKCGATVCFDYRTVTLGKVEL
jgi:hypothetical protein